MLLGAEGLGKSFAARPLFQGLSLTLEEGERVGLIGPNGAGKSTLLRIPAGRLAPDDGHVSQRRRVRIAMLEQVPVFQVGATVESTLLEGAASGEAWECAERARNWMSRLGLEGAGYGADIRIDTLSGGWRKRVALGRELMREPDLLLLDEPTTTWTSKVSSGWNACSPRLASPP
jgi:ATP-binding cassette subfamily F protein uup